MTQFRQPFFHEQPYWKEINGLPTQFNPTHISLLYNTFDPFDIAETGFICFASIFICSCTAVGLKISCWRERHGFPFVIRGQRRTCRRRSLGSVKTALHTTYKSGLSVCISKIEEIHIPNAVSEIRYKADLRNSKTVEPNQFGEHTLLFSAI